MKYAEVSPRELEIAQRLKKGMSTADCARELGLAEGTVKALTARIYRALGISSREELVDAKVETWAKEIFCQQPGCGLLFTPAREGQRFHSEECVRGHARLLREARELVERDDITVQAWRWAWEIIDADDAWYDRPRRER
jgi:DNA-binding CsgD family transcriptional regulator